jgi:hypothetical protein
MNERIRELALQAGAQGIVNRDFIDVEKFAELIVKEMLKTCEEHPAWTGRMIGNQIKEHFGVEE